MTDTPPPLEDSADALPTYADIHIDSPPPLLSSFDAARAIVTESPLITTHSFSLRTGKGRPWLTLTLRSRATSAKYLPLFCDHDVIAGELLLDLQAPERLKGVTFTFRGSVTLTGQDEGFFVQRVVQLWTPPNGAPTGLLPAGQNRLTINFPIPLEAVDPNKPGVINRLPPTFTERASPVYVNYQLSISVRRPGIRPNRKLTTSIGYLPREVAGRPSLLRLAAYQAGTPLLGPEDDSTGWHVLPPVSVEGSVFNNRSAIVEYTLAIAYPLSFVVNSPIPLFLTMKSADNHALDLLASSQQDVQLIRVLAHVYEAADMRSSNTFPTPVGRAVFWPQIWGESLENTRTLQGELHIPKGTKPSFAFRKISLSYKLVLLPPTVAGFTPTKGPAEALVSETVAVTVAAPKGVHVRSFLPPDYAEVRNDPNFSLATGLMENGNMRFVHIHAG